MMGVAEDDLGDGMQCSDHPFRANPGGICALCLQDKLGKLVSSSSSSSFPLPPASSSPSPSFRSDFTIATSSTLPLSLPAKSATGTATATTRVPFLSSKKKKKLSAPDRGSSAALFKRSKSTSSAAPRRSHFLDADTPRKRGGFWSFLHLTSSKTPATSSKLQTSAVRGDDSRATVAPTEGKVSRSRSVGCGSRRFSGDFFERISTGFGDCTLRRVESQREGKHKPQSGSGSGSIKERAKCGGLFGGFITTSSSSSSSSSAEEVTSGHGRSRSWGWALASPMRAFSKPSSGKRDIIRQASDKNATTPNLAAIPSLLAARG